MVMRYVIVLFYKKSVELNIGNILDVSLLLSQILITSVLMGIAFQYPVNRIFELCQEKIDTVDLDEGGEWILVARQKGNVRIEKLKIGDFTFLSALNQGKTFEEACILALRADSAFNLEPCFQRHVLRGTILWR